MNLESVVSLIKTKLAATHDRFAVLKEQRRPYALDAATGNAKAQKTIEQLDAEIAATHRETETLTVALEEAEKRKIEREAELAAEDHRRREAEAQKICKGLVQLDEAFDRLAIQLCSKLAERETKIRELAALNIVYFGMIKALSRKRNITGALVHAGLHRFAELNNVGFDARQPLSVLDKSLREPLISKIDSEAAAPGGPQVGDFVGSEAS